MTTDDLLKACIPLRLSVQTDHGPLIVPLWFDWDGTHFWCASKGDAVVVRALEREPVCAFDLSTNDIPYSGIRGRALTRTVPKRGGAVLERLIERYRIDRDHDLAKWLLSRADDEVALEITPTWQTHWDYSHRMSGLR